jgi:outer membrane scaffolding protein for murein synthesis (MipA/OmpV family)
VSASSAGHPNAPRLGGWALIVAAIAFMAVFSYLAVTFDYPDVLDGDGAVVLPRLLTLGATGRAVWAIYGMLPWLLVPAGLGAHAALRTGAGSYGRAALVLAIVSAFAMSLGLLRWPSIHWALAGHLVSATTPGGREGILATFDGLNAFLGQYIGEFVGELTLNLYFLCIGLGMRRVASFPRWAGIAGVVAALVGLVAMWRNVTPLVRGVAEVENYLLPAWMVILGVLLVRFRPHADGAAKAQGPKAHGPGSLRAGLVALALLLPIARPAIAQQAAKEATPISGIVVLGAGVVPEFPGASDLQAIPFIGGRIEKGRRYLAIEGITARLNVLGSRHLEFGPVLNLTFGRDSVGASGFVAALPSRDLSVEVGGFAALAWNGVLRGGDEVRVMLQAARGVNDVHEGWLGSISVGWIAPLSPRLFVTTRVGIGLMSDAFADTYFSVSDASAGASGLPAYAAAGGMLDAGVSGSASYALSRHWALSGAMSYRRLLGNAGSSPIVEDAGSANQIVAALGVGYIF